MLLKVLARRVGLISERTVGRDGNRSREGLAVSGRGRMLRALLSLSSDGLGEILRGGQSEEGGSVRKRGGTNERKRRAHAEVEHSSWRRVERRSRVRSREISLSTLELSSIVGVL